MKYYPVFIVVFLLAVASIELKAQFISDYVCGMNFSTMTIKNNGIGTSASTPIGFHFGGLYEIPLNHYFSIQPGFMFSAKGSDYKIDTLEVSLSPGYFEIPVNAAFSFGPPKLKVTIFGGPYIAMGMGGYKIVTGDELRYLRFGSGEDRDLRLFDSGFNAGARVQLNGFLVSVQYGTGLTNIAPVRSPGTEMRNKVFALTISGGNHELKTKKRR